MTFKEKTYLFVHVSFSVNIESGQRYRGYKKKLLLVLDSGERQWKMLPTTEGNQRPDDPTDLTNKRLRFSAASVPQTASTPAMSQKARKPKAETGRMRLSFPLSPLQERIRAKVV